MKTYDKSIAILRVFCILAVILIHTTTRTLEATNFSLINFQWTLFLNQISRFAVPLFIAISGFVLELNFNNHINYLSYFKKRISRIVIPYLFWSFAYYFFIYTNNPSNFLKAFFTGSASYQLYFIPTLCIYYFIFPFLHKIYKYLSNKWIIILLFIIQISLLYHDYFVMKFKFDDSIRITLLSFFMFILGMVTSHNKDKTIQIITRFKIIISSLTAFLGLYVFWEGKSKYLLTNNYLSFYSQWRPSVLLYSVFVGATFLYVFTKNKFMLSIIEKFSKLSYFVFFAHVIILELIWFLIGKSIFEVVSANIYGKIFFDPLFFSLVSIVSFLFAFIIHKISNLYKITG